MKALVVRAPGDYGIEEVEKPLAGEKDLVIKVLACGLCGSDLRTLRNGHRKVTLPWIIGHEVCGVVHETGKSYSGPYKRRERIAVAPLVYCGKCDFCLDGHFELCENYREIAQAWPGGFAEYMLIPGEALKHGTIQAVPSGVSPFHASLAEPLSSCIHAQEKGNVGLGDKVVIIGSGPVGCMHIEIARARGAATIIIADIDSERLKFAAEFVPDHIINSKEKELVTEVRKLTGGKGADVIITANPVPETQVQAVEMAAKGGRILLFGGLPGKDSKSGIDTNLIHYNALTIMGTTIFSPRHNRVAMDMITGGRVRADQLISNVFPLKDFRKGADLAMSGKALKVIFEP
ncbi:MAG: alcohol dehydrogenase catalytic domain-containing protein [Bacteroidales bacterium]|nr:alcohol dehydrogenase catalytic domain-containing protein [Bacteroidales bacterium]